MSSRDPRSSSTQSLVPESADREGRRRLLLVYIHGFQGNETSFRSFPAHVHNLVTITLGDSHVVHTKIYPKYQSRYAIEKARDNFSAWLTPHEDQWTDVILLSHSMGGLIAADVALLFRHRIVGTIEFDVPFLGMHPGIVKAGLGSIFKPWPMPEEYPLEQPDPNAKRSSRMNTLFNPKPSDPNFNPTFYNDVNLPVRKGWENTLHWLNKHSSGVIDASKSLVQQHLEFGGAMADYRGLKARYARIRALEEDDEEKRKSANPELAHPPRIRFVNYWTASTGRPKKPKSPKSPDPSSPTRKESSLKHQDSNTSNLQESQPTPDTHTPSIDATVEQHIGDEATPATPQVPPSVTSPPAESSSKIPSTETESGPELPEIPPIPKEPPFVDLAEYPDRAQRKAAEKEHSQALKEYNKAVKARNKIINARDRIEEKWEKQQQKQKQAQAKRDATSAGKEKTDSGHESEIPKAESGIPEPKSEIPEPEPETPEDESETPEEDLSTMHLTTIPPQPIEDTPYTNYDFSNSVIMNQKEPKDQTRPTPIQPSSSTDSTYTESTYSLATTDSNNNTTTTTTTATAAADPNNPPKNQRIRKFCILPPKDAHGNKDQAWIKVDMGAIDEVAAHTTLFFVTDTYERLVGDVGARIEDWVREADGLRAAREMEGLY
ncbi:hypothetical protein P280DRAFT_493551 [Massarina eburnea CBS 473.64]|uniref:AB hydrolase-1 domain-containing protein n=1 Tax=Massarina eburnea CBS 473.64 TaxID=1395130 RepID=A0A6A6RNK4_9PLEO|nr:hypothetical protein P280DRAFT_493551 [Massarina eburnea CBS 473.64]